MDINFKPDIPTVYESNTSASTVFYTIASPLECLDQEGNFLMSFIDIFKQLINVIK